MRIRCLMLAALLALCACFSGCLRDTGIDQYAYVSAIGFDRGEKLPYKYTCMLHRIDYQSGQSRLAGAEIVTAEGSSLFEAINTLSASLPLQLSFVRTVLLVAEHSLLSDDTFLRQLINTALPSLFIRYNASLFVSLSSAEQVLRGLHTELDPGLVKMQENFTTYSKDTGLIPMVNLMTISESFADGAFDIAAPLCGVVSDSPGGMQDSVGEDPYAYLGGNLHTVTDMDTEIAGAAIFSGGRMVGTLSGQNTQLLQMAVGEFDRAHVRFGSAQAQEIDILLKRRSKTKIILSGGERPVVTFQIRIAAFIEQPDMFPGMRAEQAEEWIRSVLEQRYLRLYAACRSLGADVFGIGTEMALWCNTAEQMESLDVKAVYAQTEAVFDIDVKLTNAPDTSAIE